MADDELVINITERRRHPYIELSGVVDVSTVPQLRQALLDLTGSGQTRIEIDLRDVDLLDSTGIGALAEAYRNGASLTLLNPSPTTMRQLAMSGVDRVFTIK
jgi:anti-sigma B factor antagonist